MSILGIDTSANRTINWTQAKADGVKFAIIKASQGYPDGSDTDASMKTYFINNVNAATNAGILCGAYHFLSATNANTGSQANNLSAETQAKMLIDNVKAAGGFSKVKLPLCIDIEDVDGKPPIYGNMTKAEVTAIAKSFALTVSKAGFVPCLYTNLSYWTSKYDHNQIGNLPIWYARWGNFTQSQLKSECPGTWFWQTGNTISASWTNVAVAEDYSFIPLDKGMSSDVTAYWYLQTKVGTPVYIDYCTDTVYAPSSYSLDQIKQCIRPMYNAEIYVSATTVSALYDQAGIQAMSLVRY